MALPLNEGVSPSLGCELNIAPVFINMSLSGAGKANMGKDRGDVPPRTREPSLTSFVAPSRWSLILSVIVSRFDTRAAGGGTYPRTSKRLSTTPGLSGQMHRNSFFVGADMLLGFGNGSEWLKLVRLIVKEVVGEVGVDGGEQSGTVKATL